MNWCFENWKTWKLWKHSNSHRKCHSVQFKSSVFYELKQFKLENTVTLEWDAILIEIQCIIALQKKSLNMSKADMEYEDLS